MRIHLSLLIVVAGLGACAAEPPTIPPTELTPIASEVKVDRLWSHNAGKSGNARFTPYVTDDAVFVASRAGVVSGVDKSSGKLLWSTDLELQLGSGVAGAGGQIYVSTEDGIIQSLDAESGKQGWSAKATSEVLVPVSAGFDTVVVRSADGRIVSLDPDDGNERWSVSYTPPALTLNGYSRPLLLDGGALVGLDDGRVVALNLANGREIWESVLSVPSGRSEVERLVDVDADARIDDTAIYVVNYQGKLARLEPARGQIIWSVPLSSASGLTLLGDQVIVVDEEDIVHAIDKETGQELWSQDALRGRRLTPPQAINGNVVIGDFEGYLHVVGSEDGSLLGRRRVTDEALRVEPVLADDVVFVQASDGTVAALRPTPR